jgi:hypothetical protein
MRDYHGDGKATKPLLPLIAIPTTAGTGSECQSYALVSRDDTHEKMACGDPKARARAAILDSDLTATQPRSVAIQTGLDALAHALESSVCTRRNAISALYSEGAFRNLAQAIGNEVKRTHPNKVVLYVSSEKFINQFMDHSRNNAINDFIHFYQLIDVLIVDDVQFFAKAEKSQDALFAIFNHLHQSGKQLVLTSDKPPKDLEGVQERLLSRFRWGLSADLQVPDYETRIEILERKMKHDGLEMPKEVVKYIAYNISNNIRELEGALISLLAQSSLNRREIDLDLAKKVLRNFVKSSSKEITIETIQKMVCDYFDVPYDKL